MHDTEPIAYASSQYNERGARHRMVAVSGHVAADDRSHQVSGHLRATTLVAAMAVGLLASACAASAPASKSSTGTTAATTPTSGAANLTAVRQSAQVLGTGTYSSYTVAVPSGWSNTGNFVVKYNSAAPGPVLGISVWNVGLVYRDPCHWQGDGFVPKPGVDNLVAALVAQKMRNATTPTDVTLDGYAGKYLEWSVPTDLKSSTWTQFDACDIDSDGNRDFLSWLASDMGQRFEQVPGQVDRLWVLNVNGQRLVVDATYSPDTSQADRTQLDQVVSSIQIGVH